MAERTAANPYGLDSSADLPAEPVQSHVPLWSENYVFNGSNVEQNLFFYLHFGRVPNHPTWWEGVTAFVLPSGEHLHMKSWGEDGTSWGPGAGGLQATCLEPLRRWRVQYKGMCHRTAASDNRTQVLHYDLPLVPVELDLVFEALSPMWSMTHNQSWSDGRHFEQHVASHGWVRYGDDVVQIDATGFRDHSIGRRDLNALTSHAWVAAYFPEIGRCLNFIACREGDNVLELAFLADPDRSADVKVLQVPYWETGDYYEPDTFEAIAEGPDGKLILTGQITKSQFYWVLDDPSSYHPGVDPEWVRREKKIACLEAAISCEMDGQVGQGFIELSLRQGDTR